MLSRSLSLIWIVLVGAMFVYVAMPAISQELNKISQPSPFDDEIVYGAVLPDNSLGYVEGKQVLGMVILALRGEYILVVDGISINSTTNIETINLSGVANGTYQITYSVHPSTSVMTVVANIL